MVYVKIKIEVNKKLKDFYEKDFIVKMKFRSYINKLRSEAKLVNNIKRLFMKGGKEVLLVYGDWSRQTQMRGCISTPCIGLKRMLAENFKIKNINEFRTSCLDRITFEKNKNAVVKCKNGKEKELHSVLVSKISETENGKFLLRFQNRNRNAVLNMRTIFKNHLEKGERHKAFTRSKEETPIEVEKEVIQLGSRVTHCKLETDSVGATKQPLIIKFNTLNTKVSKNKSQKDNKKVY